MSLPGDEIREPMAAAAVRRFRWVAQEPWRDRPLVGRAGWKAGAFSGSDERECPHMHSKLEAARKCSEALARRLNRKAARDEH